MQKSTSKSDPLAIPDFLKVANRPKLKAPKGAKKKIEDAPPADPLADLGLAPETEALLRSEIKTGRFMSRWLSDPSTIFVFEREHQLRKAKKERKDEDRLVERKINRVIKPAYGVGLRITVLKMRDNAMAKRTMTFSEMVTYLGNNPTADIANVIANTDYTRSALNLDVTKGYVKIDVIADAKAKPKVAAKKEKK